MSPRRLFTKMKPTGLPIPPYPADAITYDDVTVPQGDPHAVDEHLNLAHYERVRIARDAADAENLRVNR